MSTLNLHGLDESRAVLGLLQHAAELAARRKRNRWEFAVELQQLQQAGATISDVRALLVDEVIEAAVETTSSKSKQRKFRKLASLAIPPQTCFVLSSQMEIAAEPSTGSHLPVNSDRHATSLLSHWDDHSQTL